MSTRNVTDSHPPSRPLRVAGIAIAVIITALTGRAIAVHLGAMTTHVSGLGAWGRLLFVAGFAIASVIFVPAGLLTLAAGAVFGFAAGLLYAFLGSTVGACTAFLVSRYMARAAVTRHLDRHPRARSVVEAIGRDGRRIAMLMRLSPVIPFGLVNVAMGVTPLPFADFLLSCAAMLPVTALYTYYGAAAGSIARAHEGHEAKGALYYASLAAGLLATTIVSVLVGRIAKHALDRAVHDRGEGAAQ